MALKNTQAVLGQIAEDARVISEIRDRWSRERQLPYKINDAVRARLGELKASEIQEVLRRLLASVDTNLDGAVYALREIAGEMADIQS